MISATTANIKNKKGQYNYNHCPKYGSTELAPRMLCVLNILHKMHNVPHNSVMNQAMLQTFKNQD
jgi:hypothetical protein